MFKFVSPAVLALAVIASPAAAQDGNARLPPDNARKLSEIVAKVEQRAGFRYVSEIEWDEGGYVVTYFTDDQAKVEVKYDPVSGEPKSLR